MDNKSLAVYRFKDGIYLNITNRCPNLCVFCIKTKWKMDFRGSNLGLEKEPSVQEILSEMKKEWDKEHFKEIIFCGYGEPTLRLSDLIEICKSIKEGKLGADIAAIPIRLNTIGLGNLVHGKDITKDLKGVVDAVAISLNTTDEKQWLEIVRPQEKYREKGFESVKEFIKLCAEKIKDITVTAVDNKDVDMEAVREYAKQLKIKFKLRPYL
ncbi:MAG TPA: TatD family nuclease-associated radical SAM protein [Elusimicrobiales bacterium]|nr:TatD family nuclease-associated radical SAM protein [Elusimicrobiales bacterium]